LERIEHKAGGTFGKVFRAMLLPTFAQILEAGPIGQISQRHTV